MIRDTYAFSPGISFFFSPSTILNYRHCSCVSKALLSPKAFLLLLLTHAGRVQRRKRGFRFCSLFSPSSSSQCFVKNSDHTHLFSSLPRPLLGVERKRTCVCRQFVRRSSFSEEREEGDKFPCSDLRTKTRRTYMQALRKEGAFFSIRETPQIGGPA